ncbi:hypothetical protein BCR36DRAFT_586324 [Piromyces finnis]|uniref:Uncharacterized protein n=1 Tax=Piromyces finnis TaxID=1754191 RepID=A0A1Y1UZP7_9FUNG|nr:hypothetical protein BCR36DRAFT_586324 [Piromyces finnis]|eukprot:ORX44202.1 hypothetical protein BCR36DRAFT_586324 [Piromyces finnis]
MSEITLCESNNFDMKRSKMVSRSKLLEEPLTLNENCIYPDISKTEIPSKSPKEKTYSPPHYTPNVSSDINKSLNSLNEALLSGNEKYHNYILNEPVNTSNKVLSELASTLKTYNDDVSYMMNDVFNTNISGQQTDLSLFDVDDFFKYSLIVGKKECSISEKLMCTLRYLSKSLTEKTQEVCNLQEQLMETSNNKCFDQMSRESYFSNDVFNNECVLYLEEVTKQMESNKMYYQNQVNDLINEIRQRDELLDCYQKRENYLFNQYYPELIDKYESINSPNIQINMNQQLIKMECDYKESLEMKDSLINEIRNEKEYMELRYAEELKSKNEMINDLKLKEKNFERQIEQYKIRSDAQVKLAEQVKSQIQSQQIEYCKKVEEMQQNLDSRGKIIAYVKNKLSIRENELKIANIKFTTAERQMNIEKDQYKREISNLKEELEKTNEDIEDLENELDSLEEEHKEEVARLEKEHDFQMNKLWNIIDQRENTINSMEDEMEELKEKTKSLEEALSKSETSEQEEESGEMVDDDVNEKSDIPTEKENKGEIILLNENDYESNVKKCSPISLTLSLTEEEKIIEDEKTGLTTTEEQFNDEETNSLTLTEDLSEEDEERREFIEEDEEDEGDNIMERSMKLVIEENEQLKCKLDLIMKENSELKNQLEQEKESLKQENERCNLQQKECQELSLQYSQMCEENEKIKKQYQELESENKKNEEQKQKKEEELKTSLKQQATEFQNEREEFENQIKQLEEKMKNTISKEQYYSLQKNLEIALENANEQRRKKNYLKQKLASQHEKNNSLVELVKSERVKHKEEIRQLKQSCVKQNGKIKAVLKQMKDGLVTAEHIDLDRIVKRMKSERLLMSNEYERLKKVASTLSMKSIGKKQTYATKNESLNELPLNYKESRKDLSLRENGVEIMIKGSNVPHNQNNESKILIKVAPGFESLTDQSIASKKANDSLNSIDSVEENQELEEFSLKQVLSPSDSLYPDGDERNSFVDFTTSYDLDNRKEATFNSKDSISLILNEGGNKMNQRQINLYNKILQLPGVLSINGARKFEFDDSNFSITSDSSLLKDEEEYMDKRGMSMEAATSNRTRYNSYSKSEYKGNNRASLRRMPNFDQISKLTQIRIKHSMEEIMV